MNRPDQQALEADLREASFLIGVDNGDWGPSLGDSLLLSLGWPRVLFWIAAAERQRAPNRFYVQLDCSNYKTVPPTGTFWDLESTQALSFDKRPKGKPGSRVAQVFRTDWNNGTGFYHPYDRVTAQSHSNWRTEQPGLVWDTNHTIVDFLAELHLILHSPDYVGIG